MDYVTSDWHFGHHNICGPEGFCDTRTHFKDADEMDEYLIRTINQTVEPKDNLYHLGDLSMNMVEPELFKTLSRLNGQLHLIRGNHDVSRQVKYLDNHNYKMEDGRDKFVLYDVGTRIKFNRRTYYLSHYPMVIDKTNNRFRSMCGDIHTKATKDSTSINVGIDSPELPVGHRFGAPVQFNVAARMLENKYNLMNSLS